MTVFYYTHFRKGDLRVLQHSSNYVRIGIRFEFSDTELSCRFQESSSCIRMSVGQLQTNRTYPITFMERIGTQYGPSILISLCDSPKRIIKIFLPRIYCSLVTDTDIDEVNSAKVSLSLVYQGQCTETKAYKLAIEKV
jgi:hypothetical protein